MTLDAQRQIGARHAAAVVGHADQAPPAAVGDDLDAFCTGIERVLDKLLHGARRALDHLAGGDAVDDGLVQLADGHRATQVQQWSANLVRRARRCEGRAVLIQ